MMATTTFRDLPNTEDKTLFLVMDGENNLTGDPATIDRMMERKETTEVRIIRLLTSSADSEEIDDSDEEDVLPRVKLTVEEILPENGEEEIKPVDSAVPPDFVDPLSQLDNDQMLKLKKALASEQAKQLLGDNVTAMLDVLSVDDNPTMFLQNSIRRDHCYTPLSPSADPRGASFVMSDTSLKKPKVLPKTDPGKPSGSGLGQQSKINITTPAKSSDPENENEDDEDSDSSEDSDSDGRDRSSDSDYRDRNSGLGFRGRKKSGRGGPWGSRRMRGGIRGRKPPKIRGRVRKDTDEIMSEITEEEQVQPPTPVETPSPTTLNILKKKGRPRKGDLSVTPKGTASASQATTPEPPVVIPIDHVAAKVYSADAIRLGRPQQPKSEEERKRDMARIMHKLDASGQNGSRQIKFKGNLVSSDNAGNVRTPIKVIAVTDKRPPLPKMDDLSQMIETLEDGLEQETISVAKVMNKPIRTYVRKDDNKTGKLNLENKTIKAPVNVTAVTNTPTENIMGGKYPRRENRKLPSHFADTIGPELFSSQDIIRKRINAQSAEETSANKGKVAGKVVQKTLMKYVVKSSSPCNASSLPAEPEPSPTEHIESVVIQTPDSTLSETVSSIETILEGFETPNQITEKETEKDDQSNIENLSKSVIATTSETTKKEKIILGKDVRVRRKSAGKQESAMEIEPKKSSKGSTSDNVPVETPTIVLKDIMKKKVVVENKSIRKSQDHVSSSDKVSSKQSVDSTQKVAKADVKPEESPTVTAKQSEEQSPSTDDRKRNAVKRRRSDEVSDLDSDIDDTLSEASWNSEDDPERLWCICQKPHNNRFMICCDACEDWFHGKCVGITKSIGKQMEQDGLEWSCPPCSKKKRAEEKEKENKGELKQSKLSGFAIKRSSDEADERKCIMCKGPVRENSIYCSDKCIKSHSLKAIAQISSTNKQSDKPPSSTPTSGKKEEHVIVMDPTRKKVLAGSSAPTLNNLSKWLQENPSYHVLYQKTPNKDATLPNVKGEKKIIQIHPGMKVSGERSGQTKLIVSPNSKHIKIVSRPGGPQKVIQVNVKKNSVVGVKPENRVEMKLKTVESPKLADKKGLDSPKPVQRRRKEKHQILNEFKSPTHPSSKMDDSREEKRGVSVASEQVIRDSVRKTLGEALKARKADSKDLESKEIDIESLATKIEDRLYKHFDNKVDVKYKSKYRSLVFNIKDVKNETLYRKILENSISPRELVRLTADEMASQELAQWREKENQHQLEMIKKTELELMSLGQTFILKSHKGEEVIEKDPKVAAVAAALDPNTSAKELVSAINSVTSISSDPSGTEEKTKGPETSLMKMNKKEKERRREREKKHRRDRSRSKGSRHSKSRRRSRSRSRDRRRSSRSSKSRHSRDSRDKDKHKDKAKDKDLDKEKVEAVEGKQTEISTFAQFDDSVKDLGSDEAEYDPASVVPMDQPESPTEELEDVNELASVWAGKITMEDVAGFHGIALEVHGDCSTVDVDVGDELFVVGRIPYNVVWDYLIKVEKMTAKTKEIILMQILPLDIDVDKSSFSTLFNYLSKRSRTGVVSRISDQIKDFYLYPHKLGTPLPKVISHITIPSTKESDIILGIMIKTYRSSRPAALPLPPPATSTRLKLPLPLPKSPLDEPEVNLTSPSSGDGSNIDPRKRKIRVQIEVPKAPSVDDGDSPYSPASSDEDLPPLKLPRKTAATNAVANSDLTPKPVANEESFADAAQIQKRIEEMNRAIEEETLQIQNLASSVKVPLHSIVTPTIASTLNIAAQSSVVPNIDIALKALKTLASSSDTPPAVDKIDPTPKEVLIEKTPMELDIPLPPTPARTDEIVDKESSNEPDTHITPAAPSILMPEVAQISFPSDLHEILANINKQSKQLPVNKCPSPTPAPKSPEPLPPGVEDLELSATKQPVKAKPDRNAVFESDGVPAFAPFKKPIKFDLKLKDRELDEKPSEVNNDIDERNKTPMSSLDQRIALALDQDEREPRIPPLSFGDRDERSTRMDRSPIAASSKDKDDRLSRNSLSSDRDYRKPNRWRNDNSYKRRGDRERSGKWKDDLEEEWSGSIRRHEDEARRRNRSIRTKEIEMLKQEVDRESD